MSKITQGRVVRHELTKTLWQIEKITEGVVTMLIAAHQPHELGKMYAKKYMAGRNSARITGSLVMFERNPQWVVEAIADGM